MRAMIVIGILLIVLGLCAVVKGKIPFIKKYNGVRNIAVHSRSEGGAALFVGILFVVQYFTSMSIVTLLVSIVGICFLTFILEIILKAI